MHTMYVTAQQAAILEFIGGYRQRTGASPSQREIQQRFGFASRHAVPKHLSALQRKGLLERAPGKARTLAPAGEVRGNSDLREIPVLGAIPAGFPVDAVAEAERTIKIDERSLGLSKFVQTFGLEVRGDSMIGAHIADGDLAILERRPARHGDIVAALIDGEVTLKRLIVEGDRKFLRAENTKYADLVPVEELVIQGVLQTIIRTKPSRL